MRLRSSLRSTKARSDIHHDCPSLDDLKEGQEQIKKYHTGDYKNFRTVVICFRGNKDYKLEIG